MDDWIEVRDDDKHGVRWFSASRVTVDGITSSRWEGPGFSTLFARQMFDLVDDTITWNSPFSYPANVTVDDGRYVRTGEVHLPGCTGEGCAGECVPRG